MSDAHRHLLERAGFRARIIHALGLAPEPVVAGLGVRYEATTDELLAVLKDSDPEYAQNLVDAHTSNKHEIDYGA